MGIIRNYHSGMCFFIPYVGHMAQLSNPEKKGKCLNQDKVITGWEKFLKVFLDESLPYYYYSARGANHLRVVSMRNLSNRLTLESQIVSSITHKPLRIFNEDKDRFK